MKSFLISFASSFLEAVQSLLVVDLDKAIIPISPPLWFVAAARIPVSCVDDRFSLSAAEPSFCTNRLDISIVVPLEPQGRLGVYSSS